ncbi:hypothetical protein FQR65_LT00805 [Abscondita terminalis]|nr:hypothetical protein FQR65_LT00805 [Abscondita terminalis]
MKRNILLGFLIYLSVITHAKFSGFNPQELECIAQTGVDKDHIEKVILDDSSKYLIEDDAEFNKFLHCFFVVRNLQSADGELKYDNIIEHVSKFQRNHFGGKTDDTTPIGLEIATQAVQSCRNLPKGITYGETAVKAQNCIDKRMEELIKENL